MRQALRRAGLPEDAPILRKSLDARNKRRIVWVYAVGEAGEAQALLTPRPGGFRQPDPRPVVVGAGPAGLFAAYWLGLNGVRCTVLEQGEPMRRRLRSVARFCKTGELNERSNICFGAGGAGTLLSFLILSKSSSESV